MPFGPEDELTALAHGLLDNPSSGRRVLRTWSDREIDEVLARLHQHAAELNPDQRSLRQFLESARAERRRWGR